MGHRYPFHVIDPTLLTELRDKDYRDEYMQTYVRTGIAHQIQALRNHLGMTQADFAIAIDKKQSVVSRLENTEYGKASVQTLLDIASKLDIGLLVQFCDFGDFIDRATDLAHQRRIFPFAKIQWLDASVPSDGITNSSPVIFNSPVGRSTKWQRKLNPRVSSAQKMFHAAAPNTSGIYMRTVVRSGSGLLT